ncbi:MAG: hypothetical protein HY526_11855 [Betaproteobacteria bacterium]|nr:hypothetical protein [Betaproteobacteria bacterium]
MKQVRDFLESFIIVVLVVAGLVGISYHMFRGGGWFEAALGRFAAFVFERPTVSIPIVLGVILVLAYLHDRRMAKGTHGKRLPTLILYALMAAGAYFIGHYAIVGTL